MSVPKRRKSKSKVRTKRSHLSLRKSILNKCSKCDKPKRPHRTCVFCGSYKGKEVVKPKVQPKKKTA